MKPFNIINNLVTYGAEFKPPDSDTRFQLTCDRSPVDQTVRMFVLVAREGEATPRWSAPITVDTPERFGAMPIRTPKHWHAWVEAFVTAGT